MVELSCIHRPQTGRQYRSATLEKKKHNRHDEGIVPYKETDCNSHMQRQERDEKIIVARELQVGEINRLIGLFMSLNILGAWTLTICIDNSHELVCGLYAQVY